MTEQNENVREMTEEDINEVARVRREKLSELISDGKNPYEKVRYERTHNSAEIINNFDSLVNTEVSIAGRIISRRIMGKASFCHLMDGEGNIQIYVRVDSLGEEYESFKKWDIGDIVGVKGVVFMTHKGEISVNVSKMELLSKSLLPLPEKYHGLRDPELRYRMRHLDLISNPEVKNTFRLRSKIISSIRAFLDGKGFIEVETPILNPVAGGANARPFITHHNTLDIDMFMRVAPELYLKRLIVGGFDRVYELGRTFRNEGMSIKHNPEFTIMELYQAYSDYTELMDLTEEMYAYIRQSAGIPDVINYQGTEINIGKKWQRLSMVEAVKKYTGLDFNAFNDKLAKQAAADIGVKTNKTSWGEILYEVFDAAVESQLTEPVFIYDYPIEVSPLSKKKKSDPRLTERFEFFIYAREMGNAYSELNDPIDQKERFEAQSRLRAGGDDEAQMTDDDFVTALEYGMPPTGGLGIGIDRLVMLLSDSASIRDVILFPTMKPRIQGKKPDKAE